MLIVLQKIVSFGYRHEEGGPNVVAGIVVVDIRKMFRNPYHDRALRYKRGTDVEVQADILKTPRFQVLYEELKKRVTVPGTEVAYIGCSGGHHRSVFLAELLGKELNVPVEHRDFDKK